MTLLIQKNQNNFLSLTGILVDSVFSSRTYRIDFTCDQKRTEQSLVISVTQNGDRFDFEIEEGVDITFNLVGFYTWELFEVNGTDNLLTKGKAKVIDVRTLPNTPTVLNNEQTYVVANGGQ